MRLPGSVLLTELGQQRALNKRFGFERNRDVFAIKGKGLVSLAASRQEVADFLLRLDRGTICRAELGVCGTDQLGSKFTLDPLQTVRFKAAYSLVSFCPFLKPGLLEVPATDPRLEKGV